MFDSHDNKKDFYSRTKIIFILLSFLSCVLVYNLYVLQVKFSQKYSMLSDKNRIRLSPILPKRGKIISADGRVVANSNHKYKLVLESCDEKSFLKNMDIICSCIHISNEEKEQILELRKSIPKYAPIIVKDDLSWEEYSRIALVFFRFNHVSIDTSFSRFYDMPYEFSHVIGHTSSYDNHLHILSGKTGIEAFFDDELRGDIGNIQTEINAAGKKMRIIDSNDPIDGKDVTITIDSTIQKFIYDLISVEKAGACVVLDATNGEVLALVSVPGFNCNMLSSKITQKQWNDIINDNLCPLMNRVTNGLYPPGSIFKIIIAFTALREGIINPSDHFFCSGEMKLNNHVFHCVNRYGHGNINLYDAIRKSCDCYFFDLAKKIGIEKIVKYSRRFGFGMKTGIEIPNESTGLLPDRSWKFLRYGSSWKPYETILVGIGQGAMLSTLIQIATMFGKIYSNNYAYKPTLIKKSESQQEKLNHDPIEEKDISVIKEALFQVCNKIGGTAEKVCHTWYGIAGKTGSSQVRRIKNHEVGLVNQDSIPWKYRDHAFFVGCAPYNKPKYIVAVLIEHGGWGSRKAAPIARKIFDRLMENENYKNR